jgi:hypothetical protein
VKAEIALRNKSIEKGITQMQKERMQMLDHLFACTIHLAKRNHSFREFDEVVDLCDWTGGSMGAKCRGRATAQRLLYVIEDQCKEDYVQFLTTAQPLMGRAPHVGTSADKMTEPNSHHDKAVFEIVHGRVNF